MIPTFLRAYLPCLLVVPVATACSFANGQAALERYRITEISNQTRSEVKFEDAELLRARAVRNLRARLSTDEEIERAKQRKYKEQIIVTTRGTTIGFADPENYEFIILKDGKVVQRQKGLHSVSRTPDVDGLWWDTVIVTLDEPIESAVTLVVVRKVVESQRDEYRIEKRSDELLKKEREGEQRRIAKKREEQQQRLANWKKRSRNWVAHNGQLREGILKSWTGNEVAIESIDGKISKVFIDDLDRDSRNQLLDQSNAASEFQKDIGKAFSETKMRRWKTSDKTAVRSGKLHDIGSKRQVFVLTSEGKLVTLQYDQLSKRCQAVVDRLVKKVTTKQQELGISFYQFWAMPASPTDPSEGWPFRE